MLNKIKEKWKNVPITLKVSSAYTICSILQKCLSFITLPLFTRLLTTEQYGQYTIYSSWSSILMIFLTLNLAYGSFQTAMIKYENKRSEYITSIQGICLFLSFCFLIIYFPLKKYWNIIFELPTIMILLMISEIIFTTATQLWMSKMRFEYKYKSVVAVTLLISILSPVLAYILVCLFEEKGYARIVGYSLINILIGFFIFINNCKNGKKFYNKEFWKFALRFNVPLLVYYLSQVIFNQSDRIMISHMVGTSEAAMYSVAYNLAMILSFVLNAINDAYVPWLYGLLKNNRENENKNISLILSILISLMILCVIWYAPEIISIMAGSKYSKAIYVVAPVSMSLLLLYYSQLFINIEFYYEEKKLLVYGSTLAAILNIVLNYILIPIFGFVIAGYTTLISYIVFSIANYSAMRKCLKYNAFLDNLYDYRLLLLVLILFMSFGFSGVLLYDYLKVRLYITLIIFLIIFIYRKKFFDTIKKIKGR